MTALMTTARAALEAAASTECPACGKDHDRGTPDEFDFVMDGQAPSDADAIHHAAHCCLWRQYDHATRTRIAQRVEEGSTWAEAIDGETNA